MWTSLPERDSVRSTSPHNPDVLALIARATPYSVRPNWFHTGIPKRLGFDVEAEGMKVRGERLRMADAFATQAAIYRFLRVNGASTTLQIKAAMKGVTLEEVRVAIIDLLANGFIKRVSNGKFKAIIQSGSSFAGTE